MLHLSSTRVQYIFARSSATEHKFQDIRLLFDGRCILFKMYLFAFALLAVIRQIRNHHFQCQVFVLTTNLSQLRNYVRDFHILSIPSNIC